jgi:hypothetical protein
MLTFRMDETNFAEGDLAGVRIATGTGLKVDFDEFAADGQTLGLWHLHDGGCQGEGTGLEDASGNGHPLTNWGAEPHEDGYRFVAPDDYMVTVLGTQPERAALTIEGWVRDWTTAVGDLGTVFDFRLNSGNYLYVTAQRRSPSSQSRMRLRLYIGETLIGLAQWAGQEVDDLLAGAVPWHIAAVLDAPNRIRLFVNGIQRAEDTTDIVALPEGSYTLHLSWPNRSSMILDEVRLSQIVRYSSDFTPYRLLTSGLYTGLTFDGIRTEADWTDLVRTEAVPPECQTTWDVRAADETDAGGNPQAVWQPYSGDPAELPDGRYFQWRAALAASEDRLASPAIESVETLASEAGHNLYHATGAGPGALDYAEPWAQVGPSVPEVQTDALAVETVHWFGIRPVDADGRESPIAQGEVRLEIDAQGGQEPDRPAGVLAAAATPLPLGAARLQWRYRVGLGGVLPQTFRVFGDGGTGTIDYETPLGEVPWREGQAWYAWTSDPLAPGVEHQLAVRAVTAGEVWDEQPAVARITPDAAPPGEVDILEAETAP